MNKENQIHFPFTALKGRKITAVFDEPTVSSDGGLVLIREALIETGVIRSLAKALVKGVSPIIFVISAHAE